MHHRGVYFLADDSGCTSADKERLELQYCDLEFFDPDFITNEGGYKSY